LCNARKLRCRSASSDTQTRYTFRISKLRLCPLRQIAELQTKCGAGVGAIYARLHAGRYLNRMNAVVLNPLEAGFKYEDITETIRLALIGGNEGLVAGEQIQVSPTKAMQLVRDYVHSRPLLENWKVASAILSAFLIGYSDPEKTEKKSPPETEATPQTAKAGST